MNKYDLIGELRGRYFNEAAGCDLSRDVVAGALDALLDTIKARAAENKETYWQHVGTFRPMVCGAGRRWGLQSFVNGTVRYVTGAYFEGVPYVRISFRRAAALDKIR